MGSKNKLKRFIENESFSNVIQPSREELISNKFNIKGNWNNLVFKTIKNGYSTEINNAEKEEILELLQLLNHSESNYNILKDEFETIVLLDEFYFKILEVLHVKYKDNNIYLDKMYGQKRSLSPKWKNFNKYQIEQHLKRL